MTVFLGRAGTEWLDCFPEEAIDDVIRYVTSSWAELVALYPREHHGGEAEPTLTRSLALHLDDPKRRRGAAIGGRFHAERSVGKRRSGRVRQVGRTDIEYHYPAQGSPALTLEFKKLKGTSSWRGAYRNFGMAKFLHGPYAKDESVGVMIGMVTVDLVAEARAIRESIIRCRNRLACCIRSDGTYVSRETRIEFDNIHFESRHYKLTGDDMRLHHILIPLMEI